MHITPTLQKRSMKCVKISGLFMRFRVVTLRGREQKRMRECVRKREGEREVEGVGEEERKKKEEFSNGFCAKRRDVYTYERARTRILISIRIHTRVIRTVAGLLLRAKFDKSDLCRTRVICVIQ